MADTYTEKENAKDKLRSALSDYFTAAEADGLDEEAQIDELLDLLWDQGKKITLAS